MSRESEATKRDPNESTLRRGETGLTWRSSLAIIYGGWIMLPVVLYISLMSGSIIAGGATYITVILFTELSRLTGRPMKKQELFIIFVTIGWVASSFPFIQIPYRSYYMNSPLSRMFTDPFTNRAVVESVPSWWAPPVGSLVLAQRGLEVLLYPSWLYAIVLIALGTATWFIAEVAMALIVSMIYIEVEQLPYPFAPMTAAVATTLSERPEERLRIFSLTAFVAFIYAFVVYAFPTLGIGSYIPLPWADFTRYTQYSLPGALLGISTDILPYSFGFLIPFNVVVYILIGSFAVWVFGNHLALTYLSDLFPQWKAEWVLGMPLELMYERSLLWIWITPQIGITIAAAVVIIGSKYKVFARGIKSFVGIGGAKVAGYPRLSVLLGMFLAGTLGSVAISYVLIPEFYAQYWYYPLILSVGWTFVFDLVSARIFGEVGPLNITQPPVWQSMITLSGYPKIDAFFAAPLIGAGGAGGMSQAVKIAYLTDTKPIDYFKALAILAPVGLLASFFYTGIFWTIAPMPSSTYPWTRIAWPVQIIQQNVWISRSAEIFRPELALDAFVIIAAVGLIGEVVLSRFVPFSIIALVSGTLTLPPYSLAYLVGGIIGKYILQRRMGVEKWTSMKPVVAAGLAMGVGVAVGLSAPIAMVAKAMWSEPY